MIPLFSTYFTFPDNDFQLLIQRALDLQVCLLCMKYKFDLAALAGDAVGHDYQVVVRLNPPISRHALFR